tara:strand:+ start:354 stop:683 length:330 start_codon:yes stop_codon:yes gene_type:complete
MANITLTFSNPLPEGIQVGDIAWYLNTTTNTEVEMGPIISITDNPVSITVNAAVGVAPPTQSDFVFYAENPIGFLGQLKGYYAEAQFRNSSTASAELFSIGSEIFESSK